MGNVAAPEVRSKKLSAAVSMLCGTLAFSPDSLAQLEEIIVTAQRRDQTITDVPYNITAISAADLEANRTKNFADLAKSIAGFSFINQGDTSRSLNNRYSLRGLNANSAGIIGWFADLTVAPVSTYIGNHPISVPITINDLQRVEVLRGPQGTLYGSGSLGGTIRLMPHEPYLETFEASLAAEVSQTKDADDVGYDFDGMVNIPIGETAALRLVAGHKQNAGYIDARGLILREEPGNAFSPPVARAAEATPAANNGGFVFRPKEEDVNESEVSYFRGALKVAFNENIQATLTYHREEIDSDSQSVINPDSDAVSYANDFLELPGAPFLNAGSFGSPTGIFGPDAVSSWSDTDDNENLTSRLTPSEFDIDILTLDLDFDLGFATLTSATSLVEVDGEENLDSTGTWINPLGEVGVDESGTAFAAYYGQFPRMTLPFQNTHDVENWSQELRLVSSWDKSIDYVIGYFYTDQKNTFTYEQRVPGFPEWANSPNYPDFAGGFIPWTSSAFNIYANQSDLLFGYERNWDFEEHALFGEVTWYVTDAWQITVGGRYFDQEFDIDLSQNFGICGALCSDTGTDPSGLVQAANSSSERDQIFRFNTSYELNLDHSIYFNWAQGFRRGGSNNVPTTGLFASREEYTTFDPDESTSYEIGAKGVFNQNLRYSAAIYFVDWTDVQVDSANAAGFAYVLNGGDAETQGLELELTGQIGTRWTYNVSYAYTDAEMTDPETIVDIGFFGVGEAVTFTAESGESLPGNLEHTAAWFLDYAHPLGENEIRFRINGAYRDDTTAAFTDLTGRNEFDIDSFTIWDASITYHAANWSALLFADNLGDEEGITGGLPATRMLTTGAEFFRARPRTVGLRLRYDF